MAIRRLWTRLSPWLRRVDLALLLTVLAVSGAAWAFIELADEVVEGDAHRFDTAILLAFRDHAGEPLGPRWLQIAVRDVTALGGTAVLLLILAAVAAYAAMRRAWGALALVVAAPLTGLLLSLLLKSIMGRPRPDLVPALMRETSTSFPSGHSLMSAVVYATLGALLASLNRSAALRLYCLGMALLLTLLVGVSRVYLGVHWPTDVLAGWCAGLAWAVLCWFVARWLQLRGAIDGLSDEAPGGPRPSRS